MVYNRPTTEFNQFCAVSNDAYNHTSYLQKHWDGNGITDQIMYSLGFFPTWKKKNPERAPGIPLGVRVSFGGDTFVKNTHSYVIYMSTCKNRSFLQYASYRFHTQHKSNITST